MFAVFLAKNGCWPGSKMFGLPSDFYQTKDAKNFLFWLVPTLSLGVVGVDVPKRLLLTSHFWLLFVFVSVASSTLHPLDVA